MEHIDLVFSNNNKMNDDNRRQRTSGAGVSTESPRKPKFAVKIIIIIIIIK